MAAMARRRGLATAAMAGVSDGSDGAMAEWRGCASGRMRQDTLLSSGGLASPPFPPPPFTFCPGARPIIS
eukprot:scaffold3344_cov138-Isochrysis_galbana.AAC.12